MGPKWQLPCMHMHAASPWSPNQSWNKKQHILFTLSYTRADQPDGRPQCASYISAFTSLFSQRGHSFRSASFAHPLIFMVLIETFFLNLPHFLRLSWNQPTDSKGLTGWHAGRQHDCLSLVSLRNQVIKKPRNLEIPVKVNHSNRPPDTAKTVFLHNIILPLPLHWRVLKLCTSGQTTICFLLQIISTLLCYHINLWSFFFSGKKKNLRLTIGED